MVKVIDQRLGDNWALYNGDSAELLEGLPDNSIDLSIESPPFEDLYVYSASARDVGNARTREEFWNHYGFIIRHLLRVTKPGRAALVHCEEIPAMLAKDGYIGMKDFPGDTIRAWEQAGWVYDGRVTIWKNAQALRDGTTVLTPTGWVPIEVLMPNDEVIGGDGLPTKVTGTFPQGRRPLYRVQFSDGSTVDCDAAHRWAVRTPGMLMKTRGFTVLTTEEILRQGLFMPSGAPRFEIPLLRGPVEFAEAPAPSIDPYLLGVLLGDGSLAARSVAHVTTEHEIVESLTLPEGHLAQKQPGTDKGGGTVATYHIIGTEWHRNDVLRCLQDLGLLRLRAWEKFIPTSYLLGSVETRQRVLQGLMDTDGSVSKAGEVSYTTTSPHLAHDVAFIVQSLGGIVRTTIDRQRTYMHKGEVRTGRTQWKLVLALEGIWCPFTMKRKVKRWEPRLRQNHRSIMSISPVGEDDCTCISVRANDGLYVTENCVVTHNSQAVRVHAKGLSFEQLHKDQSWARWALADYILKFRKPGENAVPIRTDVDNNTWIDWAAPIWLGIAEGDTLNKAEGREADDDRHIAPLQLGTIERCIRLWSNPGETILDPYSGIGSTSYMAVKLGRKGIGIELKPSYHRAAVKNLERALAERNALTLFDLDNLGGGDQVALEVGGE